MCYKVLYIIIYGITHKTYIFCQRNFRYKPLFESFLLFSIPLTSLATMLCEVQIIHFLSLPSLEQSLLFRFEISSIMLMLIRKISRKSRSWMRILVLIDLGRVEQEVHFPRLVVLVICNFRKVWFVISDLHYDHCWRHNHTFYETSGEGKNYEKTKKFLLSTPNFWSERIL